MTTQQICLTLIQCESEYEIIQALKKTGYWDKSSYWRLYGDDENNYSVIGNQQSKPEPALVEKIINSVDAILMRECLSNKIQPESTSAPQSINEALHKYFKIYEGKLTNITPAQRSVIADKIGLVATGQKTNPNYIIFDEGEGQSPDRLHDTILSLRKSNKLRIPFVQGKFNMGGTGVLRFCGDNNIQIVLSKRCPDIARYEQDESKEYWGFTVVRRNNPDHGAKSSSYSYLAPEGKILRFIADELPIIPRAYPEAYGSPMKWGTYIKCFEYKISQGLKSVIMFNLYYKLSVLLPYIALPIKLYERRKNYLGHSMETVLSGLAVRVDEDRSDNVEANFPTTGSMTVLGQPMRYSIYVFKKGKHSNYTEDEGIIFTVNGQTHGYLSKSFFNRKSVGLNYLADSILVILDCSEIDGRSREDLFMNSRDRLSTCSLKTEIEHAMEEVLKNHQGLSSLKNIRRKEEIESQLGDNQPLAEVLENIIKKSPLLSKLFVEGLKINNPFDLKGVSDANEFKGKEFPTYFKLEKVFPQTRPKPAHLGSKFRLVYKTDVVNDYFDRNKDTGSFRLLLGNNEIQDKHINLWNGFAYLSVGLGKAQIGDILVYESIVSDAQNKVFPFVEKFYVEVIHPNTDRIQGTGHRRNAASNESGTENKKNLNLALPNIIEVSKDGRGSDHTWEKHGFNQETALNVKGSEQDGYDFFINVDNFYLLTELKSVQLTEVKLFEAKYKFGLVLLGLALLNQNDKQQNRINSKEENCEDEDVFKLVERVSKAVSPIIIPMIDTLGALESHDLIESMPEEG